LGHLYGVGWLAEDAAEEAMMAQTAAEADVEFWGAAIPAAYAVHRATGGGWLAEADADVDVATEADAEFWGAAAIAAPHVYNYGKGRWWLAEAEAEAEAERAKAAIKAGKYIYKGGKWVWKNREEIAEGLEQGADWAAEFAGSAFDAAAPVAEKAVDAVKSFFSSWLAEHGEEAM
jgi:hypothetical protein